MTNLKEIQIKIGDLFRFLESQNDLNPECFEEVQNIKDNIYIENIDREIVPIYGFIKKRVNLHKYLFKSGRTLTCSDKHIVLDKDYNNIYMHDANFTNAAIQTLEGLDYIIDDNDLGNGIAYDISIPAPHLYTTVNGIIHHNTTCTRILAGACSDPLYINASLERGIDVIRETVMSYATASSLFGGEQQMKVVVLEECDNLTNDAWASLRATIEQFHSHVRFIANCNYIDKIPEPIQSRFNCISLEPINMEEEEYLLAAYEERVKVILNACHITYNEDDIKVFVKNSFPDMRTIIKKIQQLYTRGCTELTKDSLGSTFDCSELFKLITSPCNAWNNYKALVGDWSNKADDAILSIGQKFPDYLMTTCPDKINKLPLVIIAIAEYNAQLATSIDKFVTLLALVFKLQMILTQ